MNSPMGDFLKPDGFEGPRGLRALAREGSTLVEVARFARRARTDRRVRGRTPYASRARIAPVEPVLLVPGFMAGDYTLRGMAHVLRSQGYRTYRSDIVVNVGCTREAAERLERRLEAITQRRGRKATIVGHSLGGMLARGLAARRPDLVEGIVTMGSPVLAPGASHQVLMWNADLFTRLARAGLGGFMAEDCVAGACAREAFDETHAPLPDGFPFTAIYSQRDGIVDWRACLDPAAEQVEVRTSHCGMAVDPVVIDLVLAHLREQALTRASRTAAPSAEGVARLAVTR